VFFVAKAADGSDVVGRATIGVNGVVPPM